MAIRPVPHKITQPYAANPTANNPHPRFGNYQPGGHSGVDFGCPLGTPVVAPEDMTITWAGWGKDFPNGADMSHAGLAARYYFIGGNMGIGVIGETGRGAYALIHLNRTDLNPGDRVRAGDIIGYSGDTGLSTAPHLHVDWIPAPPNYGTPLYGRANPVPRFTTPYRINGRKITTAAVKAKAVVLPTPREKETTVRVPTAEEIAWAVWKFWNKDLGDEKSALQRLRDIEEKQDTSNALLQELAERIEK